MKLSLKIILIVGMIGLVAVSVSVITLSSIITSKKVLLRHSNNIMENIAEYTISRSHLHLIPAKDATTLTRGLAKSNVVNSDNTDSLVSYFYEQLAIHHQFSAIYFGSTKGEFIMASRYNEKVKNGFLTKIIEVQSDKRTVKMIWKDQKLNNLSEEFMNDDAYDPRKRPWFKKAQTNKHFIWTDPYIFFTSQKPGITSASPVFNTDGKLLGVFGVDIEIDEISNFLSKLKIGKNGKAFIVSQSGDVIAFPDITKIKHSDEGSQKIRLTKIGELEDEISRKIYRSFLKTIKTSDVKKPVFLSITHEKENYHAMFSPFQNTQWPWFIGIYIPEDDYLGEIKENSVFNIYISIFIAVIFSIIGLFIARSIIKPVNRLQRAAIAVKNNDLTTEFETDSLYAEIQETAVSFAQMRRTLKKERDFLEEKVAERTEDYKDAKEEADRANQRKSEFLANISHELRSPLHGILGYSKLAVERSEKLSKEKSLKYFENIVNAGNRLLLLINDLLDLSKQEAGHAEYNFMPSTLSKLVHEIIDELDALIKEKNISVHYSNPDFDDLIWLDSDKMRQVIRNLMSNAIKFSDNGGEIEISIEGDNNTLVFSIVDHGIGIPDKELEAVFDKFVQSSKTKTWAGGTGLGLSICHHIISDHNGKIWAKNNPGGGAIFRFKLPREQNIN